MCCDSAVALSCVFVMAVFSIVSCRFLVIFFFKQKTAYEMRISDWSSDVCSSDLLAAGQLHPVAAVAREAHDDRFGRWMGVCLFGRHLMDGGGHVTFQIGRAHDCTPVTNAHLVCCLLLEKKHNFSKNDK